MATTDVFYPTGFTLTELTAALRTIPHLPSQLGDSGLFGYDGVTTTTVQIERDADVLSLVPVGARGSSGSGIGRSQRDLRAFIVPHLPLDDKVLADEVQGVRMFGSESQATPLQMRVMEVMTLGKRKLDYTLEHHRLGAVKGIVEYLNKDGSTTTLNLFTEFGVAQNTLDFELDVGTTEVRLKCDSAINAIEDELGGVPYTGMVAYCGRTFWGNLITHKSVKETYLNQAQAAQLRGNPADTLDFGGIRWIKWRGAFNGSQGIAATEAYIIPEGVEGLLIGRFAPADYNETVNTRGEVMYAKGMEMRNGKGWDIEMQSNPLHLCTRPRAIIKATV